MEFNRCYRFAVYRYDDKVHWKTFGYRYLFHRNGEYVVVTCHLCLSHQSDSSIVKNGYFINIQKMFAGRPVDIVF